MQKINLKNLVLGNLGDSQVEEIDEKIIELELAEDIVGEMVAGKLKFTRLEDTILLQASLRATVKIVCDRCLEQYETILDLDFDREYEIDRSNKDEDSLCVDKYNEVNVWEPIREEIVLAIPMQKICEKDCKGLCPKCGENLNKNRCKCK